MCLRTCPGTNSCPRTRESVSRSDPGARARGAAAQKRIRRSRRIRIGLGRAAGQNRFRRTRGSGRWPPRGALIARSPGPSEKSVRSAGDRAGGEAHAHPPESQFALTRGSVAPSGPISHCAPAALLESPSFAEARPARESRRGTRPGIDLTAAWGPVAEDSVRWVEF